MIVNQSAGEMEIFNNHKWNSMWIFSVSQVLISTHSHTIARKVQEVLKKVVTGLLDNPALDTESLMIFTHGLITQSFPQLSENQRYIYVLKILECQDIQL